MIQTGFALIQKKLKTNRKRIKNQIEVGVSKSFLGGIISKTGDIAPESSLGSVQYKSVREKLWLISLVVCKEMVSRAYKSALNEKAATSMVIEESPRCAVHGVRAAFVTAARCRNGCWACVCGTVPPFFN